MRNVVYRRQWCGMATLLGNRTGAGDRMTPCVSFSSIFSSTPLLRTYLSSAVGTQSLQSVVVLENQAWLHRTSPWLLQSFGKYQFFSELGSPCFRSHPIRSRRSSYAASDLQFSKQVQAQKMRTRRSQSLWGKSYRTDPHKKSPQSPAPRPLSLSPTTMLK